MSSLVAKFPKIAYQYFDLDDKYEQEGHLSSKQYIHLLSSSDYLLPGETFYLGGWLHDSRVLSVCYSHTKLSIKLNDFSARTFAAEFGKMRGFRVPYGQLVFPLTLSFSEVTQCSTAWINRNLKILPLRLGKYLPTIEDLLIDEVIRLDEDRIEMGLLFSAKVSDRKKRYLLLQVISRKLGIEEGQKAAFTGLFGSENHGVFDLFSEARQQGYYFDTSSSLDWLKNHGF
jgi:hypothetical protein